MATIGVFQSLFTNFRLEEFSLGLSIHIENVQIKISVSTLTLFKLQSQSRSCYSLCYSFKMLVILLMRGGVDCMSFLEPNGPNQRYIGTSKCQKVQQIPYSYHINKGMFIVHIKLLLTPIFLFRDE